jgi:WSC domain
MPTILLANILLPRAKRVKKLKYLHIFPHIPTSSKVCVLPFLSFCHSSLSISPMAFNLLFGTLLYCLTIVSASPNVKRAAAVYTPVAQYIYLGCFTDVTTSRIMSIQLADNLASTVQSCLSSCASQGYAYAGVEFAMYVCT